MAPASQTRALATAQARAWRNIASGSRPESQASTRPARRQSPEPIGLTASIVGGHGAVVPAVELGEDRAGAVGDDAAADTRAATSRRAGPTDLGVGQRVGRRAEVGGGLAAVELDRVGPEAPDRVERRAVGVEEDRDRAARASAIRSL